MAWERQEQGLIVPRHIISVSGLAGMGKTFLALSGPPGVAVQSWDFGTHRVLPRFPGKDIRVKEYSVTVDLDVDEVSKAAATDDEKAIAAKKADAQAERVAKQSWRPFAKDCLDACASPEIRTIVWDRADEANEVLRLANFGKLERNPQLAYVPVNMEYKQLVRKVNEARKNLVLIHGMDKEFHEVTTETGRTKSTEKRDAYGNPVYKRLGNSKADYLVDSFVEVFMVNAVYNKAGEQVSPPRFFTKILCAKLNPAASGTTVETNDWTTLMMFLAPDVPSEEWEK